MKLHLPKTRRYRIYLYILSILIILFAIDLVLVRIGRHITIAPDTTFITSPLKPDGTPDYLAALDAPYSAGITPDNNAAPLLLTVFGPKALAPSYAAAVYSRLAIPPLPDNGDYFISFQDFPHKTQPVDNDKLDDQLVSAQHHLWLPADNPDLADWLQSLSVPLAHLHEASLRPRYFMPLYSSPPDKLLITMLLPSLGKCRASAYALAARAMFRAAQGDFDAARADILAIHRLARLIAQGPTIIESLVALTMDKIATDAEIGLANSGRLTSDQARQLLTYLRDIPSLPPFTDSLRGERFCTLDILIYASRHGVATIDRLISSEGSEDRPWTAHIQDYIPSNFNAALRHTNAYYDRLTTAARAPTFAQRMALHEACGKELVDFKSKLALGGFFDPAGAVFAAMAPSLNKAQQLHDAQPMQVDLARLALALAAYHADHHAYPDSLSPLAPDYLLTIPTDLFIDAPLHYTKTPTGYVLYSVGPNMIDDGGTDRAHASPAHPKADDLVVRVEPTPPTTRP